MPITVALLEAVPQALPMQLAVLDRHGTILFVNAAWQAFARENDAPALAESSVGRNYLSVTDQAVEKGEAYAWEARQGIEAVLVGTVPLFTLEYPCHSPTEQRWFLLYAAPLPGAPGQAVVAHLNITQRKLLEEQVSAINQELRDFLSLFSHEVRSPLTSTSGFVSMARRSLQRLRSEVRQGQLSPEALEQRLAALERSLEQTEAPAARLSRLVADLDEVAQLQSNRLRLQRTPCDLGELVREVVQEQQLAWPNRQIDSSLPAQAVVVQADRERVGQVVTNYLTNALKYAPAERPIEISLRREAAQVRMHVRDEGPGVPLEQQEHIWQRFYRSPGAEAQKGTEGSLGLGLYLCRSLISQHGGQTGVESTPGAGATFWFTLPLEDPKHPLAFTPAEAPEPPAISANVEWALPTLW
jgi:signal transduction histidine kinase